MTCQEAGHTNDARARLTPAAWDAVQQETRHRVVGRGEDFGDVLRDLVARFRGMRPGKQRALRTLVGGAPAAK